MIFNSKVELQHLSLQLEFDFLIFIFSNLFGLIFSWTSTNSNRNMSTYALRNKQEMPEISFEECARRLAAAERDLHKKAAIFASFLEIFRRFHPYISDAALADVQLCPSEDGWIVEPTYRYQTLCCDFYSYTGAAERVAIQNYFKKMGFYARH